MELNKLINKNGIYLYQTDNFAANEIDLSFKFDINEKNYIIARLLSFYLNMCNEIYGNEQNMKKEKDKLYGIITRIGIENYGKQIYFKCCLDFINKDIIGNENYKEEIMFLYNLIFHPDIKNEEVLIQAKKRLVDQLMFNNNKLDKYITSIYFTSIMPNSPKSLMYEYDVDRIKSILDEITLEDIEFFCKKYINVEYFYRGLMFGNIDMSDYEYFNSLFNLHSDKKLDEFDLENGLVDDISIDNPNIKSCVLIKTYKLPDFDENKMKVLERILNTSAGLCNKILREKYGIVYSAYFSYDSKNGICYVRANISDENKEICLRAIDEVFSMLLDENILEEYLELTRDFINGESETIEENNLYLISWLKKYILLGEDFNKQVSDINGYEKDDIRDYVSSLEPINEFYYRGTKV